MTLLRLAWRESRFARSRLLLFLSSVALGVAALTAVQSFAVNFERGVQEQARELLGADLQIRARTTFGPTTEALVDSLAGAGVPVARTVGTSSMALAPETGRTRLVQLRGADAAYPFYGTIETEPADAWQGLGDGDALVDPVLLAALEISAGDAIRVGDATFTVTGVLRRVPGDAEIASVFAPRVFVRREAVAATGLLGFGSRVEQAAYLRLPDAGEVARVREEAGDAVAAEHTRFTSVADQQASLGEAVAQLARYLSLVGVFALLLGGIGVISAVSVYLERKRDTIATLRCLGATSGQVTGIYLLQALGMGAAGATIGVVLGVIAQTALPLLLAGLLPVEVSARIVPAAALRGFLIGVVAAVGFSLLPLLRARGVAPLEALRSRVATGESGRERTDGVVWLARAGVAVGAVLLVLLHAGDLRTGLWVAGGIALALLVLSGVAFLLVRLLRAGRRLPVAFPVRQGIASLHRPGNQTRSVITVLGFGVFLLASLYQVQHGLLGPLAIDASADRGNLLLFDVQEDQAAPLASLLRERGLPVLDRAPIVPMRVAAVNGREVRRGADDRDGWAFQREYRSTWRDTMVAAERLREGRWWDAAPAGDAVSLEMGIAEDLGVEVGDRITWDVQGVPLETRVASLREVDWTRFTPNFFAVFPREVLGDAPHTWIFLTRVESEEQLVAVQGEAVRLFPNISAVDLARLREALDEVLTRVRLVIQFLAAFSIGAGILVLLGAVATSRLQRLREAALLRTLGATRRQLLTVLATEYAALGAVAAVSGLLLAAGAGWALATFTFEIPFAIPMLPFVVIGVGTVVLAVGAGLWTGAEVTRRSPLESLRTE